MPAIKIEREISAASLRSKSRSIAFKHWGHNFCEGKLIHHIDGNPWNNDVDNLIPVTRKEHVILHQDLTARGIKTLNDPDTLSYTSFNLRIKKLLLKELESIAKNEKISTSKLICNLLADNISAIREKLDKEGGENA